VSLSSGIRPSSSLMCFALNLYPLMVVGDLLGVMWSIHRSKNSVRLVQRPNGAVPFKTSPTNSARALSAWRFVPLKVRLAWRGFPVTGSPPIYTRSRQTPGDCSSLCLSHAPQDFRRILYQSSTEA
jgi:hypothetical protein